ncbi:MAG: oxidative stress defense protein [Vibrionaceae bacterium]
MKKSLLAAFLGIHAALLPAVSFASVPMPHLETSGVGEITTTPDMALVQIAVSLTKSKAQKAKQASDDAVVSLLARLAKLGIAREDIQSSSLSLQPQYNYSQQGQPELEGYNATRTVSINVRDLSKLNQVLDGALEDGINRINGIDLLSSQNDTLKIQARSKAIADAINKANEIAHGFNQSVVGLWKIRYNNYATPQPIMLRMAADSYSAKSASYQDNSITIREQVDVVFRLGGAPVVYQPPVTAK